MAIPYIYSQGKRDSTLVHKGFGSNHLLQYLSLFQIGWRNFVPAVFGSLFLLVGATAQAGVIAHWEFDEGIPGQIAGTVTDSSGNGHNGSSIGGAVYQAVPGGGTGLKFDGLNDRVFVSDSTAFSTPSMTVEAVISLDTLPGAGVLDQIVFRGDRRSGLDPFYLSVYNGGYLRFLIHGPSSSAVAALHSPDILPVGELLHVAGTIDDATGVMGLFVNGVEVASTTTVARPTLALSSYWQPGIGIGNLQESGNQYLDGLIDEARISDIALAPNEFLWVSVPEPATLAIFAVGLAGVGFTRRRRLSSRTI